MTIHALIRPTGPELAKCELTHLYRAPIDEARAEVQHEAYAAALTELGAVVRELPRLPEHPDAVFVEDTAIVLPEVAVLLRPGAESRRGEVESVGAALRDYREVIELDTGTMDGGDVVVLQDTLLVGMSSRTDHSALRALAHLLLPFGFRVKACAVRGVLHLKSACTAIADDAVLAIRGAVDLQRLPGGVDVVPVPADEPSGANVARVGDALLMPSDAPRTRELLEARGHRVRAVDVSEFAKAEGAVTCKSLLFDVAD